MALTRDSTPTGRKPPPPPEGFDSWLRYAVESFDLRSAELLFLFDFDEASPFTREEIRAALWAEFNELRALAGLPMIEQSF